MALVDQHPVPHPQVASRIVDGEALLVLADSGEVTVLNGVGSRVWELVDGSRSVAQIVDSLVEEYEMTRDEVQQDVTSFIRELIENKILVLKEE